jgi:hypothetical protein
MVFNATFNNISVISWRSVLLVEETGVPWENHGPVTRLSGDRHWLHKLKLFVKALQHLRITIVSLASKKNTDTSEKLVWSRTKKMLFATCQSLILQIFAVKKTTLKWFQRLCNQPRTVGLSNCWTIELSDYRTVGPSNRRTIDRIPSNTYCVEFSILFLFGLCLVCPIYYLEKLSLHGENN